MGKWKNASRLVFRKRQPPAPGSPNLQPQHWQHRYHKGAIRHICATQEVTGTSGEAWAGLLTLLQKLRVLSSAKQGGGMGRWGRQGGQNRGRDQPGRQGNQRKPPPPYPILHIGLESPKWGFSSLCLWISSHRLKKPH